MNCYFSESARIAVRIILNMKYVKIKRFVYRNYNLLSIRNKNNNDILNFFKNYFHYLIYS